MIKEDCLNIVNLISFEELNNKSILITGASGLIGIYMLSCLKEASKKINIKIYAWIKNDIDPIHEEIFNNCEIIQHDITDQSFYNTLPNFDYIIHSAGYGQPTKFTQDKVKTIMLNTISTNSLINKLNCNGKFLFISTSEVYNGLNIESVTETDIGTTNTNDPRSCYIDSKRCGESICYSYIENGIDIKIVRLSLTYGPGTKFGDTRVLNSLIQKGLTHQSIQLQDDGSAIRTLCYITDVIEMFWNILFFGKHRIYNVGGMNKTSILDLAKKVGEFTNKMIIVPEKTQELKGSPKLVNISLNRYLNEFKKTYFVDLNCGLKKTIEWQKKVYGINC